MWNNWKNFAKKKIIRIVNDLLKIWEKLKKHKFLKKIMNLDKTLKTRDKLCTLLKIWDLLIIM